jgi:hypothetical protein
LWPWRSGVQVPSVTPKIRSVKRVRRWAATPLGELLRGGTKAVARLETPVQVNFCRAGMRFRPAGVTLETAGPVCSAIIAVKMRRVNSERPRKAVSRASPSVTTKNRDLDHTSTVSRSVASGDVSVEEEPGQCQGDRNCSDQIQDVGQLGHDEAGKHSVHPHPRCSRRGRWDQGRRNGRIARGLSILELSFGVGRRGRHCRPKQNASLVEAPDSRPSSSFAIRRWIYKKGVAYVKQALGRRSRNRLPFSVGLSTCSSCP